MAFKVQAYEYDGLLFKTEDDVKKHRACVALKQEYSGKSVYYNAMFDICKDPYKTYLILKEFYGDR